MGTKRRWLLKNTKAVLASEHMDDKQKDWQNDIHMNTLHFNSCLGGVTQGLLVSP